MCTWVFSFWGQRVHRRGAIRSMVDLALPKALADRAHNVVTEKANWDRNYRVLDAIMRTAPHGRYK